MSEFNEPDMIIPSGLWGGHYSQPSFNVSKAQMELFLSFSDGRVMGEGRDIVGDFLILNGRYHKDNNSVSFTKQYASYGVRYYGHWSENIGIQGFWEISEQGFHDKDSFHIYPLGYSSLDARALAEVQPLVRMNWQGNVKWKDTKLDDLA